MAQAVATANSSATLRPSSGRLLIVSAIYALAYYLLFQSVNAMIGLAGFSLWFPAAGLRFALIFVFGWRFGLLAAAVEILIQGLLGEWATWLYSPGYIVAGIAAPPLVYGVVIGLMQRFNQVSIGFERYHHVVWFVIAAVLAPALAAPLSTGIQIIGGRLPETAFIDAVLSFWIGDMAGILMAAPVAMLIFSLSHADSSRPPSFGGVLWEKRFWLEFASLTAATGLLVVWAPSFVQLVKGFPFLLPILWMSLRFGFKGSAFAILMVNILIVPVALQVEPEARLEHQVILSLLSATGLIMGGLVTSKNYIESQLGKQTVSTVHADRMRVMGDMTSQIIHELAQPTSMTSMYAKESARLLRSGQYTPEQINEAMDKIALHTDRLSNLVASMKRFVTKGDISCEPTDTDAVIAGVRDLIDIYAKSMGVSVTYDMPKPFRIYADEIQMQQAIMNLAKNAIEAMEGAPTKSLTIRTYQVDNTVCISLLDTGPGMPTDLKRGQSTKANGMGLGLKIVQGIAEAHDGHLEWASPNEAVVILPISKWQAHMSL